MYPEVRAEMARKNITLKMMAQDDRSRCTISTLSLKLNGKASLLFSEACAIKAILKSELPSEELFEPEE